MYRIVDTGVNFGGVAGGWIVFTRIDDEIVLRVGNVVIQVLGPDDHRSAHARHDRAIAHESSTRSVGVICTALAKIRSDIVPSGFFAHRMNSDTVTAAVDDERDRPTFVDGDIIRQKEMGDGGADGGWGRGLRLRLPEVDDRILQGCFLF